MQYMQAQKDTGSIGGEACGYAEERKCNKNIVASLMRQGEYIDWSCTPSRDAQHICLTRVVRVLKTRWGTSFFSYIRWVRRKYSYTYTRVNACTKLQHKMNYKGREGGITPCCSQYIVIFNDWPQRICPDSDTIEPSCSVAWPRLGGQIPRPMKLFFFNGVLFLGFQEPAYRVAQPPCICHVFHIAQLGCWEWRQPSYAKL